MKNFFKELFNLNIKDLEERINTREIVAILEEINSLLPKSFENFLDTTWGIATSVMHLIRAGKAAIYHFDDKKELFLPLYTFGIDKNEFTHFTERNAGIKKLFQKNKRFLISPENIKDYPVFNKLFSDFNIFSGIFEPIMLQNDVIAYLFVADRFDGQDFDEHDLRLYEIMIPFYKLILQNALMHQKEKKRLKELEDLRRIDRLLLLNLEPKRVIDLIVKKLIEIFNAESAAILLVNEKEDSLDIFSAHGTSDQFVKATKIPFGSGVTGLAAKEKRVIRINNVRDDKRYISEADSKMNSEMAAPLIIDNKVIGVLNLESVEKYKFSRDDEVLLQDFALNAAIILKSVLKLKE